MRDYHVRLWTRMGIRVVIIARSERSLAVAGNELRANPTRSAVDLARHRSLDST
jgi:hypothetical protein